MFIYIQLLYKYKYQLKISFCKHLEDRHFGLGDYSFIPNTDVNTVEKQVEMRSKYRYKYSPNTDTNTVQIQMQIQIRERKSPSPGRRRFEIGEI